MKTDNITIERLFFQQVKQLSVLAAKNPQGSDSRGALA